jgi:uncharacterized RDD family membrane protein YckC
MSEAIVPRNPSTWRRILAFILDLITAFVVLGYIIAAVTGGTTEGGFQLNGWPALLLFAVVIAYFVVFNRFLGGTIWKYILKART